MGQFQTRVVQSTELRKTRAGSGDLETLCHSVFGAFYSPQNLWRAQTVFALGKTQSLLKSSMKSICRWKEKRRRGNQRKESVAKFNSTLAL